MNKILVYFCGHAALVYHRRNEQVGLVNDDQLVVEHVLLCAHLLEPLQGNTVVVQELILFGNGVVDLGSNLLFLHGCQRIEIGWFCFVKRPVALRSLYDDGIYVLRFRSCCMFCGGIEFPKLLDSKLGVSTFHNFIAVIHVKLSGQQHNDFSVIFHNFRNGD